MERDFNLIISIQILNNDSSICYAAVYFSNLYRHLLNLVPGHLLILKFNLCYLDWITNPKGEINS